MDLVNGSKMHSVIFFNENSFTTIDRAEAYVNDVAAIAGLQDIHIHIEEFWETVWLLQLQ